MKNVSAIVMAAGLGKRMRSKTAKVLHPVADRPMIWYMASLAQQVADSTVVMVLGHQAEHVEAFLKQDEHEFTSIQWVKQVQQLGTGDAVKQAKPVLFPEGRAVAKKCVILNGDTPLLTFETVNKLLRQHDADQATVTLLTTDLSDPKGYGRVVRGQAGQVLNIVEDRDASGEEQAIREVNVGTYVVDSQFLFTALEELRPQNAQGEYYLTDIIGIAVNQNRRVSAMKTTDPRECFGINTREHLAVAERIMRQRIRTKWLHEGVTMIDPRTTWIGAEVQIGRDTVLYPQVQLEGKTVIGEQCTIRSGSRLRNCRLGDHVRIEDSCVLEEALVEDNATVGPFARLRPRTILHKKAKVGNFVEIKNAEFGEGAKANHLSYIGDAEIGRNVNIGAGTITCNYDGFRKHTTKIEDGVFIGSDSQLIAPVTVGKGALVAAGSTITQDVPDDALAISRSSQINHPGTAARRRAYYSGQQRDQSNKKAADHALQNGKRAGHSVKK